MVHTSVTGCRGNIFSNWAPPTRKITNPIMKVTILENIQAPQSNKELALNSISIKRPINGKSHNNTGQPTEPHPPDQKRK